MEQDAIMKTVHRFVLSRAVATVRNPMARGARYVWLRLECGHQKLVRLTRGGNATRTRCEDCTREVCA